MSILRPTRESTLLIRTPLVLFLPDPPPPHRFLGNPKSLEGPGIGYPWAPGSVAYDWIGAILSQDIPAFYETPQAAGLPEIYVPRLIS